ncbi:MAG: YkgJ family cysteine cluster protein [Myxococcaceae bacterium]
MATLPSEDTTSVCFSCGRCCFGPREYVQLFKEDLSLLGPELADRLVAKGDDGRSFMRMEQGHCAALDCSNGQFRCSIYEQRPLICRVYQLYGADSACPPRPLDTPDLPNPDRLPPAPLAQALPLAVPITRRDG